MEKAGICGCSNGLPAKARETVLGLTEFLESCGKEVMLSPCLYAKNGPFSGSGQERAQALMGLFRDPEQALMGLFRDPEIREIYDLSGGDLANQILDDLDFGEIGKSQAVLWGYSDLTCVLNAIYTMTGKWSVLYQLRFLADPQFGTIQKTRYLERDRLFSPGIRMVQGDKMEGILVGGNIRCFLKLAGTRYFPDLQDKILLLEARSGGTDRMTAFLSQLQSCGAFQKIRGILLGTFTELDRDNSQAMISLVQSFVGKEMPIGKTEDIGHSPDARGIYIGRKLTVDAEPHGNQFDIPEDQVYNAEKTKGR